MVMRLNPAELQRFSCDILTGAGMAKAPAESVSVGLLEAQLLGHVTHGLALLPDYVEELLSGSMTPSGSPIELSSHGAVANWDGQRLPGLWTTELAVLEAEKRAATCGIGAVSVRNSHHIACLATFLEMPARRNKMVMIFSSDPSDAHVAPFGGLKPVMTPNPIAVGIPTGGDPVMVDVSTSITTAGLCGMKRSEGANLPGHWVMDKHGTPTADPKVMLDGGSILPIGGLDHGHKGFGLSLMVEALTQGLAGFGRADGPTQWGASVLVLVLDPALFGGTGAFNTQTSWLVDACHASPVRNGSNAVRLPGEAGLKRKHHALEHGVEVGGKLYGALQELGNQRGVPLAAAQAQTPAP